MLFSNSPCLFLLYRKAINFCVLTCAQISSNIFSRTFVIILLLLLTSSRIFFVNSFGFSIQTVTSSANKSSYISSFSMYIYTFHFLFLSYYISQDSRNFSKDRAIKQQNRYSYSYPFDSKAHIYPLIIKLACIWCSFP